MIRKIALGIILCLFLAQSSVAHTSEPIKPIPKEAFSPVIVQTIPRIIDFPDSKPSIAPKPVIEVPKPKPKVIVTGQSSSSGAKLIGKASWFCLAGVSGCHYAHSGGMYAAAGPKLRAFLGKNWRGKTVSVCRGSECIKVKLIDWCQCHKNRNNEKIIDLYSDAFRRLGNLGTGVIKVTIRK